MQVEEFTSGLEKRVSQEDNISGVSFSHSLTDHAIERMQQACGISNEAVFQTISFGRISRGRGATIYAIGKKEISEYAKDGIDLTPYEGVHVVMTRIGTISTVYRNLDIPKVKPKKKIPQRIFRQNIRRQRARQSIQGLVYA